MKAKIMIYIVVLVLSFSFVFGLENLHEQITKNEIFSKIDLEHKNTKKYVSDEMTRQREQFYKDIDDRGSYYEKEANSMLVTIFWKLGLIVGGMMLFTSGMSHIMRLKTERVRFKKLEKYLLDGLVIELAKMAKQQEKPKPNMNYTNPINEAPIQDKVQEMMNESARKVMIKKLDSVYKEKGVDKPNDRINIGDDIKI